MTAPSARQLLGGQTGLGAKFLDGADNLDDLLVAEHDRLQHAVFRHLASEAFDHGDGVARAGHDQIEVAFLHLRMRRHDDKVVADAADADGAGDLEEGNLREVQGGTGADHAQDVGVVFTIDGQRGSHDLHFASIAGGEQRAHGAVDEPAGENFLGGGPAFTLDEAAGEFAGGVGLFPIIDGEGKEIAVGIGTAFDGGGQSHGVAIS